MVVQKDKKETAKFLYCSSILEKEVADAYKRLSERVRDSLIKSILLYISTIA